ncbi:MAG: acyl-[ACP]--phospholipid O-acyltransferase [Rickettsiaceae bacterium]|nr:acyl-[ACP]--phospholipid O-acyltransferase [Rickettsiaceae bacterium]
MTTNKLYLFKDRRFLPLFIVQFCGCFNDNILKNALIILITYKLSGITEYSTATMLLAANAVLILPFVLFSGVAGQLADKYERSTLVKIIKMCEVFIVLFATYGFSESNILVLYASIALMGTHSTFFGPLKYSILPDHLEKEELLGANGFVEAGTFISILIGTILGGFYNNVATLVVVLMFLTSAVGLVASFFVPKSNNENPSIEINKNFLMESFNIVKYSYSKKHVFLSLLGISWFWFIGAAILSQIPLLTKDVFAADESVANLFLAVFSIGVGVGSFWCNKLFEDEITTKYLFMAAIGISICGIDLFFASRISAVHHELDQLRDIYVFLSRSHNWRILLDLFLLSAISGLYAVPLFAVMQYFSSPVYRSRVIAANNVLNAVFMVASTLFLSLMFAIGCSVPVVILLVSLLNIAVAVYIFRLLPEARIIPDPIVKSVFKFLFDKFYRVEVRGLENLEKAGKRVVVVSNHISFLDPALLSVYLPKKLVFAINTQMSEVLWVKPFLSVVKAFPIDPNNAMAAKSLITAVKKNQIVAIFPEGRISTTGALMKIYEGPGMIADKSDANILPIRIDGPQFTHFSRLKSLPQVKLFTKVTITILPPVKLDAPDHMQNRARRKYIGQKLYDIMSEMMFESSAYKKTLFQSLIDAGKVYGTNHQIIQDIDNNKASYQQMMMKSFILGDLISRDTLSGEYVGLMLPNTVATTIAFFAMQAYGRVPTMINFTSGAGTIISACNTAKVRTIYTSRKFIEKATLHELAQKLEAQFNVVYLEDFRSSLNIITKLKGLVGSLVPNLYYSSICKNMDDKSPAVVLFTSGTEGSPKAVVLSHRNIQANRYQIASRVDFGIHDTAFNTLPMFHCFGMTGMMVMVLQGIRTFFYPSPLHYRIIPEVMYDVGATIMFGTDTFLHGYAKYAHPYDFYSLRYVFAGAEKLKAETRKLWLEKYGVRVFEGYGATETAPVVSANTSMHEKFGTVGRLMPKISYHIEKVEGITEGGMLSIKGPNVMLGYITANNPGVIVPPSVDKLGAGWYNTGDIVSIDSDGYMTILGRAKRFAKVAGEMVSLSVVEEIASYLDGEHSHAAVHLTDEKRGEQILLFTTSNLVTRDSFLAEIKRRAISEIHLPKFFIKNPDIPVLATGKVNYREVIVLAEEYIKRVEVSVSSKEEIED